MAASNLPFGSEFSPSQIRLPRLLEISATYGGDWRAFEAQVYAEFFKGYGSSKANRQKLAANTKLSMQAYGIIDRDARLTSFGSELYAFRENETSLHSSLGRHILLHLHGSTLIQCVQEMETSGELITLTSLRPRLEKDYRVHFPRGGKNISTMRAWLERAGVFVQDAWRVDRTRLKELLGVSADDLDALAMLTPEQRAFLRALVNVATPGPHRSNDIERLAAEVYGVRFNEKSLPRTVLYPLVAAGFITLTRGTREPGRGAKPFEVKPTPKLHREVAEPLMEQMERHVPADLRLLLRKPLAVVLAELEADDKHVRGLALEALAFKLMRLIDLEYVGTRLRGPATGGAEADLVFEGTRLLFSRWQIQCKNTARVSLDAVAKEVGLTHMLKSNVVVIVSTGEIGPDARRYANLVMKDSNLCVVMIDGADIRRIEVNPVVIVDALRREAHHAMKLKKIDV